MRSCVVWTWKSSGCTAEARPGDKRTAANNKQISFRLMTLSSFYQAGGPLEQPYAALLRQTRVLGMSGDDQLEMEERNGKFALERASADCRSDMILIFALELLVYLF